MENSSGEDHSVQAPGGLRSATLSTTVTPQTGSNAVGHSEQTSADLRSAPCHSSITAQTGGNAVAPQLYGCNVKGDLNLTIHMSPDNKGVEQEHTHHHDSFTDTEHGDTQFAKTELPHLHRNNQTKFLSTDESITRDQQILKSYLKKKCERIFEGLAKQGHSAFLDDIYTKLYITEGGSGGINNEHEVRQIEAVPKRQTTQETAILCNDIFKHSPDQMNTIRTVLTKGIAGIGKTVSVQKFTLDWAREKTNQDINFIFTLPFRDLNLQKERKFSLLQLLQHYFPELSLRNLFSQKRTRSFERKVKVLFIFDGLDECRLPLDFQNNESWYNVTEETSVDVLLTNLIMGNLLPFALLWITSRPAAASQIPAECIHRVTEIRGFNDPQKEEYFRKRFRDENLASRIISHIKSSRSLYIMCHIPVLCWISATVLQTVFSGVETTTIPKSLTEMYTHFLLIQTNIKNQKYHHVEKNSKKILAADAEIILKLGKLAFLQLQKGNLIFYEEDLRESGIDVNEASVYSGVCTEIFKEESGLYQEKVYCFVHLSIQEYLAALFVFHSFVRQNINLLSPVLMEDEEDWEIVEDADDSEEEQTSDELRPHKDRMQLSDLYRIAVDQALQSENGHLDLFLRFLLGLSLDSTQGFLQDLLTHTGGSLHLPGRCRKRTKKLHGSNQAQAAGTLHATVTNTKRKSLRIKERIRNFMSLGCIRYKHVAERTHSLPHLPSDLTETGSTSHVPDNLSETDCRSQNIEKTLGYIKEKIRVESSAERTINLFHCLSELNDNSLIEEVQASLRSGTLSGKWLQPEQCSALAFVLLMAAEVLEEFDLKTYKTSLAGHMRLLTVVKSCRRAMLSECNLQKESCEIVASALQSSNSPLRELDLSNNDLGDSGVELLCAGLSSPHCHLQSLRLSGCRVAKKGCDSLASALRSNPSHLRELDLSNNDMGDSGVELLCAGLSSPHCHLQSLRLSGCQVTKKGCDSLVSALRSNPSHLRELDLSYNHPGDSGVRALSAVLEDPSCKLERLNVDHHGQSMLKPGLRKYACELTLDLNTTHRKLSLSEGNRRVTHTQDKEEQYPYHPDRFDTHPQVLFKEGLSGRCYWEVDWRGGSFVIGVVYKGISRKGHGSDCCFGYNNKSWSLEYDYSGCFARHDGSSIVLTYLPSNLPSHRVGVYLDWLAGTLSFFEISSDTPTLVHTFHTTFTEPLYLGFRIECPDSTMSLCILG